MRGLEAAPGKGQLGGDLFRGGESSDGTPAILLRSYQERTIQLLDEALAALCRSILLVLPTGAGKTVVAAWLIQRFMQQGKRILFLAPRRELIWQTSQKLAGVRHGLLLAGAERHIDLYAQVQVASVDTLRSRMVRRSRLTLPEFDYVFVDETHLYVTEARKALLDLWSNAIRIGLTATPTRKDGRALGLLFDKLIEPTTTAELTKLGHLAPARYFTLSKPDLERVRITAGDYNAGDLEKAANTPQLVGDIVANVMDKAPTRRTLVFASSIAHSVAVVDEFMRNGIAAEHVDANTPREMRESTFARFRDGRTQVVSNCFLASYGFDLPELDCVVLARPTRSLMLYLQMIGRGLRTAPSKKDCLIFDHAGCVHLHGFAADERAWTLDGEFAIADDKSRGEKRHEAKVLECPECHCAFGGGRVCPECGHFFAPQGKLVKTLDGELIEIGERLEPEQQERAAFFAELRGIGIERKWKPTAAAVQFKEKFKEWPPRSWNDMPAASPTITTRSWVQSRMIAWRKARERVAP